MPKCICKIIDNTTIELSEADHYCEIRVLVDDRFITLLDVFMGIHKTKIVTEEYILHDYNHLLADIKKYILSIKDSK